MPRKDFAEVGDLAEDDFHELARLEGPDLAVLPGPLAQMAVLLVGMKRFRFVGVTHPRVRAPEAHFGADFYPLNLERIAIACNSGFPLPASSGLLPARPTHAQA